MGNSPDTGVTFVDGVFENLPPLRVACPDCIGAAPAPGATCARCAGTSLVPAPWVNALIEILEGEGLAYRRSPERRASSSL
jgi:hypothetical protein